MRGRPAWVVAAALALAGCAVGSPAPPAGSLREARDACNREYPARIGNYRPHAECVNAAVEEYAMPTARYPDLLRLQEELRRKLSERIDRRRISAETGAHRMAEADAALEQVTRDREAGREAAAEKKLASLRRMLRD